MKKTILFALLCAGILFAGCNSEPETESPTLKARLESAKDGEEIDIEAEKITEVTDKSLTVNKAVTIKNGDASGSTFEITVSGVKFENVTGVKEFLVAESVKDGEFTVTNGGEVKYLNVQGGGGGFHSHHFYKNCRGNRE